MLKKMLQIALMLLAFSLFACVDLGKNPLLGTWVPITEEVASSNPAEELVKGLAKAFIGISEITFTEDERISKGSMINTVSKVQYKKMSAKEWLVSDDDGKTWETIKIIDDNTIAIASRQNMQLKRKIKVTN